MVGWRLWCRNERNDTGGGNDMKNLLIAVLVIAGSYTAFHSWRVGSGPKPLYAEPYVVVYGRDTCGYTQAMLRALKADNVPVEYQSVDDQGVSAVLHERMRSAGLSTRRYNLPVVEVSGKLTVRPESREVVYAFNRATQ